MTYFQRLIVNTLTFVSLSVIFQNMVFVRSIWMAVVASFILSILNMFIKPILTILSLPFTLITFGLFSFVINAVMLQMTAAFVGYGNFHFSSFWSSILVAVIMTLVNSVVSDHNMKKYDD